MKREATQSVKFLKLKRRLRLSRWQAMGLLESIWDCAYSNAREGDIGRLSNEDIAACIEWDDDADELIGALVETGWLDMDGDLLRDGVQIMMQMLVELEASQQIVAGRFQRRLRPN